MRALLLIAGLCARCVLAADPCAEAVASHQAGNYAEAMKRYPACLEQATDNPGLISNYGAVLAHEGRYGDAIVQYQKALTLSPGNPGVRGNLALAYYKSGDLAHAAPELEALHREAPSVWQITVLLADTWLQTGEGKRVTELLEAIAPPAGEERGYFYLAGMAAIRSGEAARGQRMIEKLVAGGDSAEAHYLVGSAAFESQRYPAAVEEFRKAAEMSPRMTSLQSFLGRALLFTGDAEGAAAAFRLELAQNANDYEANVKLGAILAVRKQYAEAEALLARAAALRPGSTEARRELAALYRATGREALAKAQSADLSAAAEEDGLLRVGAAAPPITGVPFGARAAVVVFGSYSCPQYRFDAAAINGLAERYRDRFDFALVYVHEAHPEGDWVAGANEREKVRVQAPVTLGAKTENAQLCRRMLGVRFPIVVDGMSRAAEKAYQAWPSAIYVVGKDGRVVWRSRLGEQVFRAEELERVLATVPR